MSIEKDTKIEEIYLQKTRDSLENNENTPICGRIDYSVTGLNMEIKLQNNDTIKYYLYKYLLISLISLVLFPVYLVFFPLIYSRIKMWSKSRQILLTNKEITITQNICCHMNIFNKRQVKGISISDINTVESIHINMCGILRLSRLLIITRAQGDIMIVEFMHIYINTISCSCINYGFYLIYRMV